MRKTTLFIVIIALITNLFASVSAFAAPVVPESGGGNKSDLYGSGNELVISRENIYEMSVDFDDILTIRYFETEEAQFTTSIRIRNDADVYINGYRNYDASVKALIAATYGTIRFVLEDSSDDEVDYDKVFITTYKHMVVDSVNLATGRASAKEGNVSTIVFDENNPDFITTLFDREGNPLEWSSVKENDVIAVQQTIGDRIVSVCTLVNDVVTGKITEVRVDEGTPVNPATTIYTIGGKEYKVNPFYINSKIKLGAEGTFYLDIMGRIIYFDAPKVIPKYGYIIAACETGTLDKFTQVKMLTFNGEVKIFDTASIVYVSYTDGDTYREYESIISGDLLELGRGYSLLENATTTKKQLVVFGLNSSGKINNLVFPNTLETGKADSDYFAMYRTDTVATYDLDKKKFIINGTSVYFDDSTIIMQAPATYDEDDYRLIPISALVEDAVAWYNVSAYDVNADKIASLILVESVVDLTSGAAGIAMVISKSTVKNAEGDIVQKLTAIQNNMTVELLGDSNSTFNSINTGDIIVPYFNSRNEVRGFDVITAIESDWNGMVTGDIDLGPGFEDDVYIVGDNRYTFSKVTGKSGSRIELENGEDFIIRGDVSIYAYIESGVGATNKAVIPTLGYDVFDIDGDVYYNAYFDEINPVYALVREYDEDIKEVVFFLFNLR
ncbi:MAG: hypothetical protein BWY15_00991 [Firmicutes bacterium ADurb.Bin193]|nr:MAG: hypothetical protein BWY15_00991 [Firmicutes bacterium ADurb.Bin193]